MQLMLRWFAAGNAALAIVSAEPREGRTWLAANLAIVFSQLGDRTLLIDANLHSPRLHDVFRIDNEFVAGAGGSHRRTAERAGCAAF